MNLFHFLDLAATRYPAKPAVICDDEQRTFRELRDRAAQLGAALLQMGITKGSSVGILSKNSVRYVEILCALMKIGARGVPINVRLTQHEIQWLCARVDMQAVFCETGLLDKIVSSAGLLPPHLITIGGSSGHEGIPYEQLLSRSVPADYLPDVNEDDASFIIFTAGTTGEPKGVVLTHGNLIWNSLNYTAALAMTPADIELAPTPLFHSSTLGRVFTYLFNGMTFILCKKFDPAECLSIIQRHRVTAITQVPTMYQMMLDVYDDRPWDTRSVKRAVSGASSLPVSLKERLPVLFPGAGFYDIYGITEGGPGVAVLTAQDFFRVIDSVGKPMLSVDVKIAGNADQPCAPGQVGEILCRGPNVMQGYMKDAVATAHALRQGWLHTGDMGWLDEEGFLHMSGRKKEIIISGGINVYPNEVEEVITRHPAVKEAAVVGVVDQLWGEKVSAAVVLKENQRCTQQELIEFCKQRLASFKCPRSVIFMQELPRNAARKILKTEIKKLF